MTLDDFKNKHVGQRAFVIGKGPSLDTLEVIREQLSTGVVFCLNESIRKFETLDLSVPTYVVQQDSELESDCVPKRGAIHFMNEWQHLPGSKWYGKRVSSKQVVERSPWSPDAVLYRPGYFKGESEGSLSAIIALKIANLMGISAVTFCCFDALLNGNQGPNTYARCIGDEKQREGSHRSHNCVILSTAHQIMKSVKTLHPHVDFCETKH